jgi:hypothetical protein
MDYEFRILVAEKELAHLREMQKLNAGRLDVADTRLDRIQELVLKTAETVDTLTANVNALSIKIDTLVDAMFRSRSN